MPESFARTTISSSPSIFVVGRVYSVNFCRVPPYILLKGLEHVLHGTNMDDSLGVGL